MTVEQLIKRMMLKAAIKVLPIVSKVRVGVKRKV
jgi:hypothetical protein